MQSGAWMRTKKVKLHDISQTLLALLGHVVGLAEELNSELCTCTRTSICLATDRERRVTFHGAGGAVQELAQSCA